MCNPTRWAGNDAASAEELGLGKPVTETILRHTCSSSRIYSLLCLIRGAACIHKCNEEITSIWKIKIIDIILLLVGVVGKRWKVFQGKYCQEGGVSLINGKRVPVVDNTSTWFPMSLNGLTACPVVHSKELIQTTSSRVLKKYHIFYRNCTLISALLYWGVFVVYVCVCSPTLINVLKFILSGPSRAFPSIFVAPGVNICVTLFCQIV